VPRLFRVLEIDGVDLEQREIALSVLGTADVSVDGIAGSQSEPPDLRGRYVDVVGTRQVVGFRRPQKAEPVGQHLDDAFADNIDFAVGQLFKDRKHQFLFAHRARVLNFELFGKAKQLGRRLGLKVLQLHFPHAGNPVGATVMHKDRSSVWKGPTADLGRAQAHAPGPDALASPLGPELKNASACVQGSG
jgi:hypothetical protein